jgi:hypothetical protein
MRTVIDETIASPQAYIGVSRQEAQFVPRTELSKWTLAYLCKGDVRIADASLRHFIEVSRVGVVRVWCNDV